MSVIPRTGAVLCSALILLQFFNKGCAPDPDGDLPGDSDSDRHGVSGGDSKEDIGLDGDFDNDTDDDDLFH